MNETCDLDFAKNFNVPQNTDVNFTITMEKLSTNKIYYSLELNNIKNEITKIYYTSSTTPPYKHQVIMTKQDLNQHIFSNQFILWHKSWKKDHSLHFQTYSKVILNGK